MYGRAPGCRVMATKGLNRDNRVLAQAISLRIVQIVRMKARRGEVLDGSGRREGETHQPPPAFPLDVWENEGVLG